MDEKKICLHVLLLLNVVAVSSYLQFVVPGRIEADSSPIHVSQFSFGPYPYSPNRTVDGNFSQNIKACLHTATSTVTEAWLRIDLQTVQSIKSVKFWYRNDRISIQESTERLRGYSIRVSNSSDVSPGSTDVCFTDDMSHTLPTVIQEDCKKTTRYVWFYQPHVRDAKVPILEICEVQIFGCETGTYDVSCSKTCSHCKNNETCDIETGECDGKGCALPGFKSPMCIECISGLYGNECNFNCSQFCHDQLCYQTTGECVNGCEDGYIGGLCKTRCPNGYFGRKCLDTCGKCLDDKTCDNINGTCMDGCNEGLKGDTCKTVQFVVPGVTQTDSSPVHTSGGVYPYWSNRTVDGNFSQNIRACLHTAVSSGITEAWLQIDLQSVKSIKSVKFWYRNDRGSTTLSTERLRGYSIRVSNTTNVSLSLTDACFTDDSYYTLPTIIREDCNKTARYVWFYQPHVRSWYDKVPVLEICEVQIYGCETGTYDVNCSKTCRHCKNNETCDIDTGECDVNGCALPGFKPPLCRECRPGSYGSNCSSSCSLYCKEKACDRYSGECLYGCTPGYQKPYCVMPCMHGYYGENCTKTCGNCLNNDTCDNINGTCTG